MEIFSNPLVMDFRDIMNFNLREIYIYIYIYIYNTRTYIYIYLFIYSGIGMLLTQNWDYPTKLQLKA